MRLDISYETVRRWVLKFGLAIARRLRQRRPRPSDRWHLDDMVVRIGGERMYLWRAVFPSGVDKVLEPTITLRDSLHCAKQHGIVCMTGIVGNKWCLTSSARWR
jgi:putative transposase